MHEIQIEKANKLFSSEKVSLSMLVDLGWASSVLRISPCDQILDASDQTLEAHRRIENRPMKFGPRSVRCMMHFTGETGFVMNDALLVFNVRVTRDVRLRRKTTCSCHKVLFLIEMLQERLAQSSNVIKLVGMNELQTVFV